MALWHDEYLAALDERDIFEKANESIFQHYTKLADRPGQLKQSAAKRTRPGEAVADPSAVQQDDRPVGSNSDGLTISLRMDLIKAQRSRSELQGQLAECVEDLAHLTMKHEANSSRLQEISSERNTLLVKLRDRDEELKGKMKLVEDVQDELISLNLQLNMAEDRSAKVQKENQDLIDRWMARMGVEADAMNQASRFS